MRNRKYLVILGLVALVGVVVNFAITKKQKTAVRIVVLSNVIPTLPHWVALEMGFYEQEGIEPKEYPFTSSCEPVSAMANGDADFLPGVSMSDIMAGVDKARLKPLLISHCRVVMTPPFESLIVPSGSPIANVRDLEGKTIAVFPGQTSAAALKTFLTEKGVDITKIQFRKLPPPQHLQALQSGDVACSHAYEPYRSLCLEGGKTRELYGSVYASFNEPAAIGGTVISYKLWAENRPLAEKLIRVWDRSIRFIRQHPKEAREILSKRLNIPDTVAQKATWVDATLSSELDEKVVKATIESYKKNRASRPSVRI